MSNFDFLKDFDNTLWKLGNRIEKQVHTSPSGVKADATTFLEHILKKLLTKAGLKYNSRKPFTDQVDAVFRSNLKMSNAYRERIKSAYNYRNKIHDEFEDIERHEYEDAVQLHEKLFYIARKYYRDYNDDYDEYKGVPDFKPLELDFSDDEVELVKIPDFNEIVDIQYDYCVMCGEPNHSNYSIYCHKCGRIIDNANNFISIRNTFGKDAKFTKDDLIELGIPEGYINQLLHSHVVEDMLRVSGRFYTFNNMHFDDYLAKIDKYLAVGELITKFRENKISPSEIKETLEYRQGRNRHELFYQFYKIVNREVIKKFEKDLLATRDIWKSIDYTTITSHQLQRWYDKNLGNYQRGTINESFVVFNELLIEEYFEYKREGILDAEIRKTLNVSDEVYEFWCVFDKEFEENLREIKIVLITEAINDKKTREEIIEYAGVTPKEYMDLVKVSEFRGDELSQIRNQELESRRADLIEYLKDNDLETSCRLAKVSIDDFYKWYDDMSSEFYVCSSKILMHNFLNQRRKGRTKMESAEIIGLEYVHVDRWFKRTLDICEDFKNRHVKVIADLIYEGFRNGKSKAEITKTADVSVERIDNYLNLGKDGYGTFKQLYDYYEAEIIPKELSRFLEEIKTKPLKKALEMSELTEDELEYYCSKGQSGNPKYKQFYEDYYNIKLNLFLSKVRKGKSKSKALRSAGLTKEELRECYELGRQGDERFAQFYETYYNNKFNIYLENIIKGASPNKALKNADLTESELPDDIDEVIFDKKLDIVIRSIKQDLTTKQAAKKANVSVNDVYDWFMKGRSGDEKFAEFAEFYYDGYVNPGSRLVQMALNDDIPLSFILKRGRKHFSREDYDFWVREGFMIEAQEQLEEEDEEIDDEFIEQLKKEHQIK